MAKQRYENKSFYDPGRFRFQLVFKQQVTADDGYGGNPVVALQDVLTTRAVQEPIKEGNQLVINAGASVLNQDCYFVIRNVNTFYPEKDMNVECNGATYVIRAVIPIDVPVNYIKLLCVKTT